MIALAHLRGVVGGVVPHDPVDLDRHRTDGSRPRPRLHAILEHGMMNTAPTLALQNSRIRGQMPRTSCGLHEPVGIRRALHGLGHSWVRHRRRLEVVRRVQHAHLEGSRRRRRLPAGHLDGNAAFDLHLHHARAGGRPRRARTSQHQVAKEQQERKTEDCERQKRQGPPTCDVEGGLSNAGKPADLGEPVSGGGGKAEKVGEPGLAGAGFDPGPCAKAALKTSGCAAFGDATGLRWLAGGGKALNAAFAVGGAATVGCAADRFMSEKASNTLEFDGFIAGASDGLPLLGEGPKASKAEKPAGAAFAAAAAAGALAS
eukprot:scaffold1396_cov252-Pinguiococcus_pyrenoidosus.AAC.1